jgi:hypothetical protein
LCSNLIERKLFHVDITAERPDENFIAKLRRRSSQEVYNISEHEASYFVFTDAIRNNAYNKGDGNIHIQMKNGEITGYCAGKRQQQPGSPYKNSEKIYTLLQQRRWYN